MKKTDIAKNIIRIILEDKLSESEAEITSQNIFNGYRNFQDTIKNNVSRIIAILVNATNVDKVRF